MIDGLSQVCLVFHLRRTARLASRALDQALAGLGINASQFTVLSALAASADSAVLTLATLARRLAMDRSTLHRNLRPLQQAGLIVLAASRGRRGSTVRLSEDGARLMRAAAERWQPCQRDLVARIGDGDASRLLGILNRFSPYK